MTKEDKLSLSDHIDELEGIMKALEKTPMIARGKLLNKLQTELHSTLVRIGNEIDSIKKHIGLIDGKKTTK